MASPLQGAVEREVHVAVERHVAARAAAVVERAALEEAEVADVVGGAVGARLLEGTGGGLRQLDGGREDGVEGDGASALALAEDAEGARVAVDELEAGAVVGGDGEADGDGGGRVGRAVHAAAEALAEGPRHDGELARAADDVDAGDLREIRPVRLEARHEGHHRVDGALHERRARVVEVRDGDRDLGGRGVLARAPPRGRR